MSYLGGDFLGSELLADGRAVKLDIAVLVPNDAVRDLLGLLVDLGHLPSDEPLDGEEGVLGVDDGLALGDLADEPVAALRVGHHRRRRPLSLGVRHDSRLPSFHSPNRRVRRPQVDPHHLLAHHTERPDSPGSAAASERQERRRRPSEAPQPLALPYEHLPRREVPEDIYLSRR